jgi:hypothetical protein
LALPSCSFFRGLLYYYGLELHHLNPNSICHISIFIYFCEAFLGIEPHWDLFRFLFRVKPQPTSKNLSVIEGAGFQLRQQAGDAYLTYKNGISYPLWMDYFFNESNREKFSYFPFDGLTLIVGESSQALLLRHSLWVYIQSVLDQLPGHPWHICWFPCEYVSVSPKEADEREFLFPTQACANDSGLK